MEAKVEAPPLVRVHVPMNEQAETASLTEQHALKMTARDVNLWYLSLIHI